MTGRKQIPHKIYQILENQLIKEEHGFVDEAVEKSLTMQFAKKDQEALLDFSKQIYGSLQTVLEFMDKGMKGLLTGDLTTALL